MLISLSVSFLPSSALSLLVPPLMHPHAPFLWHVTLAFYKGTMPGSSRVRLFAASTGEPPLASKKDLSHPKLGHGIHVHQHFHQV